MILGIAQVVINVGDLDAAETDYLARGYKRTFRDDAIANHPAKRPFQSKPRESLSMSHLAPPRPAPAVELTAYGAPAGVAPFELELDAEGAPRSVSFAAEEESRRFWIEGLGFGDDGTALELRAAAPSLGFRVALEARPPSRPATMVDAAGCVLVTAVTTDVDRDFERLGRFSEGRSAQPWDEAVAGRELRVAMIEGPSGELVELLQAPSRR